MRNLTMGACLALAAGVAGAAPSVSITSVTQDPATRQVTVAYDLGEADAIVTLDVQTNVTGTAEGEAFASIGGRNLRTAYGDVNRVVAVGNGRSLVWQPGMDFNGAAFAAGTAKVVLTAWPKDNPPDYMVIELEDFGADLASGDYLRYYPDEGSLPYGIESDVYRTGTLVMRRVPAAGVEWTMGSPEGEPDRMKDREYPVAVRLTSDYYMGVFEVTQLQYLHMITNNSAHYKIANPADGKKYMGKYDWQTLPVECTTYAYLTRPTTADYKYAHLMERGDDGKGWTWTIDGHEVDPDSALGRLRIKTGIEFDLPTEAQWEFAARAGPTGAFYNQTGATYTDADFDEIGWSSANSEGRPHRVGEKKPNAFGLYDMLGNVSERCVDWWKADLRELGGDDPKGPLFAEKDALEHPRRGGNWYVSVKYCRAAQRNSNAPTTIATYNGFRLICPLALKWDVIASGEEPQTDEFVMSDAVELAAGGSLATDWFGSDEKPFDSWVLSSEASDASKLKTIPPTGLSVIIK